MDKIFGPDRYERYAELRRTAPVASVISPETDMIARGAPMWVVTRHDDVLAALLDPRIGLAPPIGLHPTIDGPDGPTIPRHLLTTDAPEHTRLRRAVSGLFGRHRMDALRPTIQSRADSLIDAMPADGQVDFLESFALPLPTTVICRLLGIPAADEGSFREWTLAVFDTERDGSAGITSLNRYMVNLIESKRSNPGDDLTSELLAGDHDLTDQELADTLMLLLVAGHETTVNLIGNGLLALLRHPDQLERLRKEPELIPDAVEELLRYDTPVPHSVIRYPRADVEIAGTTVPEGQPVLLALGSANHDLGNDDELDVTRTPSTHLAFGHGIHYCLGAPLARLEGQVAFGTILARLPRIELAGEPRWRTSLVMRGLSSLPLAIAKTDGR